MNITKENWLVEEIELRNLILWDDNPRTFDKNFPDPDQEEIISRYDINKLIKIAENIIKYQETILQPGELTVIKKGNKFVVYDGNRRISAYLILLNPKLLKNRSQKIEDLSKKVNFDRNKKLIFNIAPNITAALGRIEDLHVNNFHEDWGSIAKANFASVGIDGQIKELKEKKIHIKRNNLYKKIQTFPYSDKVSKILHNSDKFSITSLERIIQSNIGKRILNYDFNEKGEIIIKGDEKVFNSILKKVVEDVALGIADSRKQQLTEDKEIYFKKILKDLGLNKKNGVDNKNDTENNRKCFVIMPLSGLENVYEKIQFAWKKVFGETSEVFHQKHDMEKGGKDLTDDLIKENIKNSAAVVAILSMGDKERKLYDTIPLDKKDEVLALSFPFNINVGIEVGYTMCCTELKKGKLKNYFLIADNTDDKYNIYSFLKNGCFDLNHRNLISYKENELKKFEEKMIKSFTSFKKKNQL